jgi:hypothetical protein
MKEAFLKYFRIMLAISGSCSFFGVVGFCLGVSKVGVAILILLLSLVSVPLSNRILNVSMPTRFLALGQYGMRATMMVITAISILEFADTPVLMLPAFFLGIIGATIYPLVWEIGSGITSNYILERDNRKF